MIKVILGIVILSAAVSLQASDSATPTPATDSPVVSDGQRMYESYCVMCHQPKKDGQGHGAGQGARHGAGAEKGHQNRLAPPMAMVKKHYLETYPEKDLFVQKLIDWVAAPDKNSALLVHAVERFGLMPALVIDEDSRRQIALYIFDTLPVGQCKKREDHQRGDGGGKGSGKGGRQHGGDGQGKKADRCH
ncbi:MAG: hypothetical protein DRR06_00755 [Gammaproteobacteria bacterium]|nr:MAG: hypothetical protein DRR06_00755 [Gammaproteobacteria bacterium]